MSSSSTIVVSPKTPALWPRTGCWIQRSRVVSGSKRSETTLRTAGHQHVTGGGDTPANENQGGIQDVEHRCQLLPNASGRLAMNPHAYLITTACGCHEIASKE